MAWCHLLEKSWRGHTSGRARARARAHAAKGRTSGAMVTLFAGCGRVLPCARRVQAHRLVHVGSGQPSGRRCHGSEAVNSGAGGWSHRGSAGPSSDLLSQPSPLCFSSLRGWGNRLAFLSRLCVFGGSGPPSCSGSLAVARGAALCCGAGLLVAAAPLAAQAVGCVGFSSSCSSRALGLRLNSCGAGPSRSKACGFLPD